MASAARGAEEEVFETPDFAEDDLLAPGGGGGQGGGAEGRRDAPSSRLATTKVPDAEVVSSTVPPQAAFEVFMGRTYAGAREDMSDIIGASSTGFEGAVYAGEGYHREGGGGTGVFREGDGEAEVGGREGGGEWGRGGGTRTGESPMQRLVRLREETAMLAKDLEEMSKGLQEDGGGGDAGGYALWSAMAKETDSLTRQLALLSADPKFKHIVSSGTERAAEGQGALHQRLSDGVIRALESLREDGGAEGEEATAVATKSSDADVNGSGSVTYELFLKEASEARRLFSKGGRLGESIPGVEARIAALEKALGGGDGGAKGAGGVFGEGGESRPVVDTVSALENRVSLLEPGRIDTLRQKAQLARAELDGLAKLRMTAAAAGGAAGGATSSTGGAARQKKIEGAFATLQAWQGIAAGLPALVDRLRALETLHLASASFAQRLDQVEGCQTELVSVLKNTNEGLDATRESSVENVAIVNENVKALDRRLKAVGFAS
eukprot:jgi/Undpi1/6942/HiC_scaffold_21.g09416.m1